MIKISAKERKRLKKIAAMVSPAEFDADGARRSLVKLTFSLHQNNFFAPAAAIARFLLDECRTLDQAFGLKRQRRGAPTDAQTAKRDADVLGAYLAGKSWRVICAETAMDQRDARKLCKEEPPAKFERRQIAALAELLSRQMREDEKK